MRLLRRVRRSDPPPRERPAERFLLAGARQSRTFGHDHVGTEHVLLAIAEEATTPAAKALARRGLTGDVVRRDIERVIGTGIDPRRGPIDADALATLGIDLDEVTRRIEETFGAGALEHLRSRGLDRSAARCQCVAPRLKRALELAVAEAGAGPVGSEHMLLALAAVEDCLAARILGEHGVTRATLRRELVG